MSDQERLMILKLLEEGKVSADEALKLLNALGERPPAVQRPAAEDFGDHARETGRQFSEKLRGVSKFAKEFLGDFFADLGEVVREIPESGLFRSGEMEPLGKARLEEPVDGAASLHVEGQADHVKLVPSTGGLLEAEADLFVDPETAEEARKSVQLKIVRDGERLTVRVEAAFGTRYRADLVIRVPAGLAVDCATGSGRIESAGLDQAATLTTKIGAIDVDGHRGKLVLNAKGGSVKFARVEGSVDAESVTGSVKARDVRGEVKIRCSNGAIEAGGIDGPFDFATKNGVVRLDIDRPLVDGPNVVETKNGVVQLRFAGGTGATVEATTRLGRVSVAEDLSHTERDGRYLIQGGGPALRVSAQIGTITLARILE